MNNTNENDDPSEDKPAPYETPKETELRIAREALRRAVNILMEHYDAVQVFGTKHDNEEETTSAANLGGGNMYARIGQIKDWVITQDTYSKENAKQKED